jgi:hypothetical protein
VAPCAGASTPDGRVGLWFRRWLAANQAIRERLGGGLPPEWLRLGDPLAVAREALGDASYQRVWQAGLALSLEQVLAETTA